MSEQPCTAPMAGDDQPNILMTPPCGCPRCVRRQLLDAESVDGSNWLRVSGRRQRLRVQPIRLGALGQSLLG